MATDDIFSDEWRECLRAHYTYVARANDKITERTLRGVMIEAGFTDTELKRIYVLATAHVDDMGEDFVPNMDILESNEAAETASFAVPAVAMPQEVIEAALVEESVALDEAAAAASDAVAEIEALAEAEMDESELDESEMDESELEDESDELEDEPPPAPDATQLSLF